MNEMERKGLLIKKYILSLVYEDEVPEIVNAAIDELVQAAQQRVQADTRHELYLMMMLFRFSGACR